MSHIFQPTDIVLAKVKGFSAWPAMIVPTELIPQNVSKGIEIEEPNEELDDEQIKENFIVYSDSLKFKKNKTIQNSYCVKFFYDDSYIWLKSTDINLLTPEDCKHWLKHGYKKKVNKKLIPAYEMAARGSQGIDVWEFIEYGSAGKPEEEEYIEEEEDPVEDDELDDELIMEQSESDESDDYEENKSSRRTKRPTRVSARQTAKRKRDQEKNKRPTRSNTRSKKPKFEPEEEEYLELEQPVKTTKKSKTVKKVIKPQQEKYTYEDDEDWSIVGLGPQDLSLQSHQNKLVRKLTQKKNQERHNETRLDLLDKLQSISRLITDLIIPDPDNTGNNCSTRKEDYEIVIDELELALQYNGTNDEFMTVFQSNSELLMNFRMLINMTYDSLKKWHILDNFQILFKKIYNCEFQPDEVAWSWNFNEQTETDQQEIEEQN